VRFTWIPAEGLSPKQFPADFRRKFLKIGPLSQLTQLTQLYERFTTSNRFYVPPVAVLTLLEATSVNRTLGGGLDDLRISFTAGGMGMPLRQSQHCNRRDRE
jgi:hypothetical protein